MFAHAQNKTIHFVETSIWHTKYYAKRNLRIDVTIQKLLQFKILLSTSAFRAFAVDQFLILQFKVFKIPNHMQKELCKSDKTLRSYNKINTCHFKLNMIIPFEKFYL